MIEHQINNDQNNHRYTHQPAYKIFTHDASPLKYSCNNLLIVDLACLQTCFQKTWLCKSIKSLMEKRLRVGAVSHIDDELLYLSRLRFFENYFDLPNFFFSSIFLW